MARRMSSLLIVTVLVLARARAKVSNALPPLDSEGGVFGGHGLLGRGGTHHALVIVCPVTPLQLWLEGVMLEGSREVCLW